MLSELIFDHLTGYLWGEAAAEKKDSNSPNGWQSRKFKNGRDYKPGWSGFRPLIKV
jgi:hypothetical protein